MKASEQSWDEIISRAEASIETHEAEIKRLKTSIRTAKRMKENNVEFPTAQPGDKAHPQGAREAGSVGIRRRRARLGAAAPNRRAVLRNRPMRVMAHWPTIRGRIATRAIRKPSQFAVVSSSLVPKCGKGGREKLARANVSGRSIRSARHLADVV